jgi:hypothetical protein
VDLPIPDNSITFNQNGKPIAFKAEPNLPFRLDRTSGVTPIRSRSMGFIEKVCLRLYLLAMSGVERVKTLESQITMDVTTLMGDEQPCLGPVLGSGLFPYIDHVACAIGRAEKSFLSGILAVLRLYAAPSSGPHHQPDEDVLRAIQFWGGDAPCPIPEERSRDKRLERLSTQSMLRIALNFVPLSISADVVTANKCVLAELISDIWPYIDFHAVPTDRRNWLFQLLGHPDVISAITMSVPIQFMDKLPVGKVLLRWSKTVWDTFLDAGDSRLAIRPDLSYFRSLIGEVLVEPNMEPPPEEFRWLGPDAVVRRPCGCDVPLGDDPLLGLVAVVPYGGTEEVHTLLNMGACPGEQIFTLSGGNGPQFWRQARSVFLSKDLAHRINVIATKLGKTKKWRSILGRVSQQLINAGLGDFAGDYVCP